MLEKSLFKDTYKKALKVLKEYQSIKILGNPEESYIISKRFTQGYEITKIIKKEIVLKEFISEATLIEILLKTNPFDLHLYNPDQANMGDVIEVDFTKNQNLKRRINEKF